MHESVIIYIRIKECKNGNVSWEEVRIQTVCVMGP